MIQSLLIRGINYIVNFVKYYFLIQESMRVYFEAHPDANSDEHVKSVLTKAERQLKDKFDGRPTKPPPYVLNR